MPTRVTAAGRKAVAIAVEMAGSRAATAAPAAIVRGHGVATGHRGANSTRTSPARPGQTGGQTAGQTAGLTAGRKPVLVMAAAVNRGSMVMGARQRTLAASSGAMATGATRTVAQAPALPRVRARARAVAAVTVHAATGGDAAVPIGMARVRASPATGSPGMASVTASPGPKARVVTARLRTRAGIRRQRRRPDTTRCRTRSRC